MRFKKLDLNLLVALDHMLESRSVTIAADKMFMSQSAMSNALTRLRTYFNDQLLVQVGRKMELTPRAESLRPLVRDILVRTEAAIQSEPKFDPRESDRQFNVLLSDYSLRVVVPQVLRILEAQGARVGFNFLAQTTAPYLLLEQGEVDLLIAPERLISIEHPSALVYTDEYVVVAWRQGKYGDVPITKEVFESAGHVMMVPPQQASTEDRRLLEAAGLTRRTEVTTFSFSTLPHLISGTNRLGTVHRRMAEILQEKADIVIRPIPAELPVLRQMMQWHGYRESDPGIKWLRSVFAQPFKSETSMDLVNTEDF